MTTAGPTSPPPSPRSAPRTGLVVGSAPCYPYGVIDPITDLAAAAAERGVLFHTDACLGGWLLPWWERLGQPVAPWDFRVPGVTSISADIHKYGYTFKGASIVAYRARDLLERQFFWYDDWPGGLYASGTPAGTRPAPPIAGAWAAINAPGRRRLPAHGAAGPRGDHPLPGGHRRDRRRHDHGCARHVRDGAHHRSGIRHRRRHRRRRRRDGRPGLAPRPPAGRPAPDAVAVPPAGGRPFLADLADAVAEHGQSRGKAATYGGVA